MHDDPWAVRQAEDHLELYQITQELLRVLPDEIIDWLKWGHPEEEPARARELLAALAGRAVVAPWRGGRLEPASLPPLPCAIMGLLLPRGFGAAGSQPEAR